MADRLRADVEALHDLSSSLIKVRDMMWETWGAVNDHFQDLGLEHVGHAIRDFESDWNRGRRQLKEKADQLAQTVRDAADAYAAQDAAIDDGLHGRDPRGSAS